MKKTTIRHIVSLTVLGTVLAGTGAAQLLTTGGTAGTSVNAGANIGSGNNAGVAINGNANTGAKAGINAGAGAKTAAGASAAAGGNATTTPAMMGATGSVLGNTHTATQVAGAARLTDILPGGTSSYTYYPAQQVYLNPATKTYYYSNSGQWYSSTSLPAGVTLGKSQSLKLTGTGSISGTTR